MRSCIRVRGFLVVGLAATLAACAPGPRLQASWYLVYEPAAQEPYPWVDPRELAVEPAAAPPSQAKSAGSIYVSIRNLGEAVTLNQVLHGTDSRALRRAGHTGPYRLQSGEVLVLPLTEAPASDSRMCLIPTKLKIKITEPRRTTRTVKVAGAMPTSLPDEWIEQCNGAPSASR